MTFPVARPLALLADIHGNLPALEEVLPDALRRARPELCFVLAGADPFEGDRLGRLALTKGGLAARDTLVRDTLDDAGVPICLTLAGGYAENIRDTVDINVNTLRVFTRVSRRVESEPT